jgi:hypothetical protein
VFDSRSIPRGWFPSRTSRQEGEMKHSWSEPLLFFWPWPQRRRRKLTKTRSGGSWTRATTDTNWQKDHGGRRPGTLLPRREPACAAGRLREIPRAIFSRRSKRSEHQAARDNRGPAADQAVAPWSYGRWDGAPAEYGVMTRVRKKRNGTWLLVVAQTRNAVLDIPP